MEFTLKFKFETDQITAIATHVEGGKVQLIRPIKEDFTPQQIAFFRGLIEEVLMDTMYKSVMQVKQADSPASHAATPEEVAEK